MGSRAMNYIALKPGVALTPPVREYLAHPEVSDHRGKLFIYESNFTPMWARDTKGKNCTVDLEEEIAIHQFLGSLDREEFYMTRAGESECGHRGEWADHPFVGHDLVKDIESEYSSLISEGEQSPLRSRE